MSRWLRWMTGLAFMGSLLGCGGGGSTGSASPGASSPIASSTPTPTSTSVLSVAYPVNPALRVGMVSSVQSPLVKNSTENLPTTFTLLQGALPPGMALRADGSYVGTPTQEGAYDFTIQVSNDARQATDAVHVSVVPSNYHQPLAGDPGIVSYCPASGAAAYYVDSVHGLDAHDGSSPAQAWQTLAKLNAVTLKAGNVIRLARGSVWNEQLRVDLAETGTAASNIVFEAYGTGDAPTIIQPADASAVYLRGAFITVLDLRVKGARLGFQLSPESKNVLLAGNEIVDVGMGIYAEGSGHRFFSNYIHDLHMIRNTPTPSDDYGAEGIVMTGSNMEAAWNRLVNCIAPSCDFEVDGGAFETWGSGTIQHIYLHHNLADNVDGFMELTNNISDLVITHNLIINSRGGLCFHIDDVAGKTYTCANLRFENNTLLRNPKVTKGAVFTFLSSHVGQALPGNDLLVRNNIICSNMRLAYNPEALGANFVHDHNLYFFTAGPGMGTIVLDATEKIADPQFIDPSKTDFRLQAGSPAIDRAIGVIDGSDLDGTSIPVGATPDMGAYEWK